MDKISRNILIGTLALVVLSVALTYNRTIVHKDYVILSEEEEMLEEGGDGETMGEENLETTEGIESVPEEE